MVPRNVPVVVCGLSQCAENRAYNEEGDLEHDVEHDGMMQEHMDEGSERIHHK